ncbi:hypothetical protein ACSBR2_026469 [Camellia fascicularis]
MELGLQINRIGLWSRYDAIWSRYIDYASFPFVSFCRLDPFVAVDSTNGFRRPDANHLQTPQRLANKDNKNDWKRLFSLKINRSDPYDLDLTVTTVGVKVDFDELGFVKLVQLVLVEALTNHSEVHREDQRGSAFRQGHDGEVSPEFAEEGRYFECHSNLIPASIDFAEESLLYTTLYKDRQSVQTVEHLLVVLKDQDGLWKFQNPSTMFGNLGEKRNKMST